MELQGESGITGWDDQNFREVHSQTMSTEKGHFSQDDLPTINVGKVMIDLYLVYNSRDPVSRVPENHHPTSLDCLDSYYDTQPVLLKTFRFIFLGILCRVALLYSHPTSLDYND